MLNVDQQREIKYWLKENGVSDNGWDFILKSLEYDLWEVKGNETYAVQRKKLEGINNKAISLLRGLKELSWELSEELHDELEHVFDHSLDLISEEDENEDDDCINLDFRSEFERGLDEGRDKEELMYLHDSELNQWFSKVPIRGEANAFDYIKNLITSCQNLSERKAESRDVDLYQSLTFRCERIAEEHSFELSQENIVKFICACTGKEREAVKKQFERLGITTSIKINEQAVRVGSLEEQIFESYKPEWETVFKYKLELDGGVNRFWIHWELVELYNSEERENDYSDFLESVVKVGIGDILEKYGLNCPLRD